MTSQQQEGSDVDAVQSSSDESPQQTSLVEERPVDGSEDVEGELQ